MVKSKGSESTQLETFAQQIDEMKKSLKEMSEKLQDIASGAQQNKYIEPELLDEGAKIIQSYSALQKEFYEKMQSSFPKFIERSLPLSENFLKEAKQQIDNTKLSYEALQQFQDIDIKKDSENREKVMPLLEEYKKKAKAFLNGEAPVDIITASEPYRIFVENVKAYQMSDAQAEIIEAQFPGPLYRMLYRGQLFINPQQDMQGDKKTLQESPDSSSEITVTISTQQDEGVDKEDYTFRTEKEGKALGVKSFLSEIKSFKGLYKAKILYMIAWCRILSLKQLYNYSNVSEDDLDNAVSSLVREGYLTEIKCRTGKEKYYCLSENGLKVLKKKDSIDAFKRVNLRIPNVLSGTKVFFENLKLISHMVFYNEISLQLYDRDIKEAARGIGADINAVLVNCAESSLDTIYSKFTVKDNKDHKVRIIIASDILDSDTWEKVAGGGTSDFILYIPFEEDVKNVWAIIDGMQLNTVTFYIAMLADGDKKLDLTDRDGGKHKIVELLKNLQPEFPGKGGTLYPKEDGSTTGEESVPSNMDSGEGVKTAKPLAQMEDAEDHKPADIVVKNKKCEDIEAVDTSPSLSSEMASEILQSFDGRMEPDKFVKLIYQLIVEKSLMEAIVLSKTLSFIPTESRFKTLYKRLLMASNMSLDPHKYTGNNLETLDQEETVSLMISPDALKLFRLSGFAWALFMPDIPRDFMLYNYKDNIMNDISELLCEVSPASKQVFSLLFDLSNYSSMGFSSSVLMMLRTENNREEAMEKLIIRAGNLLEVPRKHMQNHLTKLPELLQTCFGKRSDFSRCMDVVCSNRVDDREFVQCTFENFADSCDAGNEAEINYSDRKINDYIDKCWEELQDGRAVRLIPHSPAMNTMVSNIKKRLDVMKEWLQLTDNVTGEISKNLESLARIKNLVLARFEDACAELDKPLDKYDISIQAGLCIIHDTFSKLLHYLRDETPYQNKWDYIKLLSSYQINLNDELKPNLNPNLQSVRGFEPWRRMLKHIASPKVSFEKALRLIDNPQEINWYSNYATAEHINSFLHEAKGMQQIEGLSGSRLAAKNEAIQYVADFKSKLELKYAYGNIEESTKEMVLQTISIFNDYFEENGDFAQYIAFLNILQKRIDEEVRQREELLVLRKQKNIEEKGLTPEKAPILNMIEATLEEKNFAVTEEYLNRFEYGEMSIPEEELEAESESDYHKNFIEMYPELYAICHRNRDDTPVNWGYRKIENRLNKEWQAGQRKSAEELIKSWPKGKDSPDITAAIRNFLGCFDFKIVNVNRDPNEKIGDKYRLFNVDMIPTKKNLQDYPHPIARFGTLIINPVHVVCLFGANSANELINTMTNKLQLGGNTIVLMDGALSHEERKKVAEKFKSDTSAQNFFLLIDRVLLLFLATVDRGERLKAMLKCTLPYTYYQPYVNGAGSINDEMFFGRKSELNSILNPNGACFVYGGRQLGKTALLQRACSIAHKPEEKRFAVYLSIYRMKKDAFIKALCDELKRLKLIRNAHTTFESLCKEISEEFDKGNIAQLQLFIDESDDFLDEIHYDNYSSLTSFVNLKGKTNNRFKFVLAGLHNVARSKSAMDRNSIFQQLGMPLCIKPLSPADARKLVERPLSYLGFKMEKTQLSLILAYTNYYPGIIHFFCYVLVESVAENYRLYYSASGGNPPYYLSDEQLRKVFVSADLNNQIKDKLLDMTLKLDTRYKIIANIFAHLYYEDKKSGINRLGGYTIEQVRGVIDIPCLHSLSDGELELLLTEMVSMGILWSRPDSHTFRLRKNSFPEMIGSEDKVEDILLTAASGEVI